VPHRDQLQAFLKAKGVGTEVYYPVPLHRQDCLQHLGYRDGDCPVAERACRELLALPVYPELTETQQDYVARAVADGLAADTARAGTAALCAQP
jgi:dTDP-4-amino-4,6-dideoxygalactose transaminase